MGTYHLKKRIYVGFGPPPKPHKKEDFLTPSV